VYKLNYTHTLKGEGYMTILEQKMDELIEAGLTAQVNIRVFPINICENCFNLEDGQCNEPSCVFCRQHITDVAPILNTLLIRPEVDGDLLDMGKFEEAGYPTSIYHDPKYNKTNK